ncbi:MAG: pyroglutamyl-peptidase I [Trueperella sp.]|nr:pyroglutamyl-peptidase I [Trueperella sp.]
MRILVTGFEPFGGESENAAQLAVAQLPQDWDHPHIELITEILPVDFRTGPAQLRQVIAQVQPDAVICVGEAGGRTAITPELRAGKIAAARIPDESGYQPQRELLDAGPEFLETRLDAAAQVTAIRNLGLPAALSDDAGAFVCNAVFRTVLRDFAGPAGFIHLPAVRTRGAAKVGAETDPDSASSPAQNEHNWTIAELARGLQAAVLQTASNFIYFSDQPDR